MYLIIRLIIGIVLFAAIAITSILLKRRVIRAKTAVPILFIAFALSLVSSLVPFETDALPLILPFIWTTNSYESSSNLESSNTGQLDLYRGSPKAYCSLSSSVICGIIGFNRINNTYFVISSGITVASHINSFRFLDGLFSSEVSVINFR